VQIGSALLPVMSGLVSVVTQAITFVGNLADEFYKAIGGAAGLQQIAAGLIKTMVVLGGVTAGVFIATNITTFATALRGVLGVMRGMLVLERAMLAVQTARAAVLSLIAGLQTPGPAQAKAVGLVTGGAVGVGLAVGLSKLIDDITKKIGTSLQGAMTMPNIPTPPPGTTPDLSGLRTDAGAKPKKAEEMSQKLYQLELDLLEAQRKENETQVASLKYEIAQQKFSESKLKNRNDLLELAKAERQYMEDIADIATKTGSAIAQDFIKRNQLQEDYKRTVEDLQIKAGKITGDKLKQVEIGSCQ
jgi:hypothetical protein